MIKTWKENYGCKIDSEAIKRFKDSFPIIGKVWDWESWMWAIVGRGSPSSPKLER